MRHTSWIYITPSYLVVHLRQTCLTVQGCTRRRQPILRSDDDDEDGGAESIIFDDENDAGTSLDVENDAGTFNSISISISLRID